MKEFREIEKALGDGDPATGQLKRMVCLMQALTEKGINLPNPISGDQMREIFESAVEAGVTVPHKRFDALTEREKGRFVRSLEGFTPPFATAKEPTNLTPEQLEQWQIHQKQKAGYRLNYHGIWEKIK